MEAGEVDEISGLPLVTVGIAVFNDVVVSRSADLLQCFTSDVIPRCIHEQQFSNNRRPLRCVRRTLNRYFSQMSVVERDVFPPPNFDFDILKSDETADTEQSPTAPAKDELVVEKVESQRDFDVVAYRGLKRFTDAAVSIAEKLEELHHEDMKDVVEPFVQLLVHLENIVDKTSDSTFKRDDVIELMSQLKSYIIEMNKLDSNPPILEEDDQQKPRNTAVEKCTLTMLENVLPVADSLSGRLQLQGTPDKAEYSTFEDEDDESLSRAESYDEIKYVLGGDQALGLTAVDLSLHPDNLFELEFFGVVEPCSPLPATKCDDHFSYDLHDNYPGFVQVYKSADGNGEGEKISINIADTFAEQHEATSNALQDPGYVKSTVTFVLHTTEWPKNANDLFNRPKVHHWPSDEGLEHVRSTSIYFLPISPINSSGQSSDDLWKLEFFEAKRVLFGEIPVVVKLAFISLKRIILESVNWIRPSELEAVLLWWMETATDRNFHPTSSGKIYLSLLDDVIKYFKDQHLPDYFLPWLNQLAAVSETDVQQGLATCQKLRNDIFSGFPAMEHMTPHTTQQEALKDAVRQAVSLWQIYLHCVYTGTNENLDHKSFLHCVSALAGTSVCLSAIARFTNSDLRQLPEAEKFMSLFETVGCHCMQHARLALDDSNIQTYWLELAERMLGTTAEQDLSPLGSISEYANLQMSLGNVKSARRLLEELLYDLTDDVLCEMCDSYTTWYDPTLDKVVDEYVGSLCRTLGRVRAPSVAFALYLLFKCKQKSQEDVSTELSAMYTLIGHVKRQNRNVRNLQRLAAICSLLTPMLHYENMEKSAVAAADAVAEFIRQIVGEV